MLNEGVQLLGNSHFTEVGEAIGISKPGKGLGITLADYDRDGKIDLFIANDSMVQFLYHNLGNGTFEEVGLPHSQEWAPNSPITTTTAIRI